MATQLRIACLGDYDNYYSYFNYGVMEGAIRNGAWFRPISFFSNSISDIEKQINWFKPHILFCHMIFNKRPHKREDVFEMLYKLKKSGVFIVYHAGDARHTPRYTENISDFIDIGIINHLFIEKYSSYWKVPCYRWPYMCLYQDCIVDPVDLYKCDIAFTGGISNDPLSVHYGRTKFIQELKDIKLDVAIFPNEKIGNTRFQTAELSASARAILGMQMVNDLPGYIDVRPFQYIGAGGLYFHDYSDSIKEYFEPKVHYLEYDKEDLVSFFSLFGYYVFKKPQEGRKIREAGFRYCQRFHSTKERVKFIIDLWKEDHA